MRKITLASATKGVIITNISIFILGSIIAFWNPFHSTKDIWDRLTALATVVAALGTLVTAGIALIVWIQQNEDARNISNTRAELAAARLVRAVITIYNEIQRMKKVSANFGTAEFIAKYRLFQEDFYLRYREDIHALTKVDGEIATKLSLAFGALEGISFQYKILVSNSTNFGYKSLEKDQIDKGVWLAWVPQAEAFLHESINPMRKLIGEDIFRGLPVIETSHVS